MDVPIYNPMKLNSLVRTLLIAIGLFVIPLLKAGVPVGSAAPDFTLTDSNGKVVTLADCKGKLVVLEWNNPNCPINQKHFHGNLQGMQKDGAAHGVIWLGINSSAPGEDGDYTAEEVNKINSELGTSYSHYLFDRDGKVGHLYDAKTTPHMFIISPAGVVLYNGAIDSIHSNKPADIARARNFVVSALTEIYAGKPVSIKATVPYGCFVHYAGHAAGTN